MAYCYKAFGLKISSEIELPPLALSDQTNTPDINVELGEVSATGLASPDVVKPFSQFNASALWLSILDVARFEVTQNRVMVQPLSDDWDSIRLFLLGSCFGAVMHLRGDLVLHGNTIRFGDGCAVFVGTSGNGKSTLASAFYQRGYEILADDLARVDERLRVQPSYPQLKLWKDSAEKLGLDTAGLKRVRPQDEKFALPIRDLFCNEPLPVRAVYILHTHNQDAFELNAVRGVEKFKPLKNHTFRPHFTKAFGMQQTHLKRVSQLAKSARVVHITRPNAGFKIDELVQHIEADMRSMNGDV